MKDPIISVRVPEAQLHRLHSVRIIDSEASLAPIIRAALEEYTNKRLAEWEAKR